MDLPLCRHCDFAIFQPGFPARFDYQNPGEMILLCLPRFLCERIRDRCNYIRDRCNFVCIITFLQLCIPKFVCINGLGIHDDR